MQMLTERQVKNIKALVKMEVTLFDINNKPIVKDISEKYYETETTDYRPFNKHVEELRFAWITEVDNRIK